MYFYERKLLKYERRVNKELNMKTKNNNAKKGKNKKYNYNYLKK